MKWIALLCLTVGTTLPCLGQSRDTVLAVHKLFQQRRIRGNGWAATGASVTIEESVGWRSVRSTSHNVKAAAVNGGLPLALGLMQAHRFSPERERDILQRYAAGWPIPPDIRRKLRRKHFHRTAKDVLFLTNP